MLTNTPFLIKRGVLCFVTFNQEKQVYSILKKGDLI